MKKARDVHRLLDRVDLTVNTDADREVLERVLRASRKSTAPVLKQIPGEFLLRRDYGGSSSGAKPATWLRLCLSFLPGWPSMRAEKSPT